MPQLLREVEILPWVAPCVHGLHGHALAHLGESAAEAELRLAEEGLWDLGARYTVYPAEWAVIGLGYAKLGEHVPATRFMAYAVRERLKRLKKYYPPDETRLFQAYCDSLPRSRLLPYLLEIFVACREQIQSLLVTPAVPHDSTLAFVDIWYDALVAIPRPINWAEERLASDRSGSSRWIVSILFVAMARTARTEESFLLWRLLKENQITTPSDATTRLAAALLTSGSRNRALQVYSPDDIPHVGLSRMLATFAKVGMYDEARETLQEITARFKLTRDDYQAIGRAYAAEGNVRATKSSLIETYGPVLPEGAIEVLVRANCNANDAISAEACLDGISPTVGQINPILDLYADRGDLASAIKLFGRLLDSGAKPNMKTYTAIIALFAKRLDMSNVDRLLATMRANGREPDKVVWAAVLNAHIDRGDWPSAAQRWQSLPPAVKADSTLIAAILRAFVYIAAPTDLVMSLFRKLERPQKRQWALVIQSASDNGDLETARDLYDEMDVKGDPKPDIVTLSILLHGYLRDSDGESARAVYHEMLKRQLVPSSITYSMIIQSFNATRSQESLEQAHDFAMSINRLAKNGGLPEIGAQRAAVNENLFLPLVTASGQLRQPDAASAYFELARNNQAPSIPLLTGLLDAYRRAGDIDKVLEIWKAIFEYACATPDPADGSPRPQTNILCIPLSIMLDVLSSQGRNTEVREIWKSVRDAGFGFDSGNYNHYAIALARTGDLESAFHVIDRVVIPRSVEVRQRRAKALRNGAGLPPLIPDETLDEQGDPDVDPIDIDDNPVDVPYGPSKRRAAFRPDNPFGSAAQRAPESFAQRLLESWRPTDILWRPSLLTMAVLNQAYEEVERETKRNVLALGAAENSDEDEVELTYEGEQEENAEMHEESAEQDQQVEGGADKAIFGRDERPVLRLQSFNNVLVRDPDGHPSRLSASKLVKLLNRKYPRTVGMILSHRKKLKSTANRERAGRKPYTARR